MPKIYSEREREYIKTRLREEAGKCLVSFGVRKTTVDELVKRVKIPKGSFYLFYECKEVLLFEMMNELNHQVEQDLFRALDHINQDNKVEELTDIIANMFLDVEKSGLLKAMEEGEWERLMRRLPERVIVEHAKHDLSTAKRLLTYFPSMENKDLECFAAALRAVFVLLIYKREIAAPKFEDVLKLVIRGIVLQMI